MSAYPLDAEGRCGLCRRGLSGFDAAYAYGLYDGQLRQMIRLLKYGKVRTLAGPLGRMLATAAPREYAYDLIVPMPMHWRRRWSRGFNQAELLARVVARSLGAPVTKNVRRRKATPAQAGLTAHQRRSNMSGAFEIRTPTDFRGKRILLVDDVLTTGASAAACARALKQAGAIHVAVLTVARADRRLPEAVAVMMSDSVAIPSFRSVRDAESGSTA